MNGRFRPDAARHLAAPAAYLALVSFSILSVTLPLGGRSRQQIAAQLGHALTPADWALSGWLLILSGLGAFVLYQFLPALGRLPGGRRLSVLFSVACLLGVGWLLAWHFLWTGAAALLAWLLTGCVLALYLQATSRRTEHTAARRFMVVLPFRFFLGGLLTAAPATTLAWLAAGGHVAPDAGMTASAFISLGVITAAALLFLFLKNDAILTLTVVWGLTGIAAGPAADTWITGAAAGAAALLVLAMVWRIVRRRKAGSGQIIPKAADTGDAIGRFTRRSDGN